MKLRALMVLLIILGMVSCGLAQADGTVTTVDELKAVMEEHARAGEGSYTFVCTKEIADRWKADDDLTDFLLYNIGAHGYHSSVLTKGKTVEFTFTDINYYAGAYIMAMVDAGREDELTTRERQTLEAAREIAALAEGSEPEREKYIHDALCRRITYHAHPGMDGEEDCAIGALLAGLADCDGYADAFYLVGRLAGLDVRHISGEGITNKPGDSAHMWNLIRLNDAWYMMDVTWDDLDRKGQNQDCVYLWYNLGTERMDRDHRYSDYFRQYLNLAAAEDPQLIPEESWPEPVDSWEAVETVVRDRELNQEGRFALRDVVGLDFQNNTQRLSTMMFRYGVTDYGWHFSPDAAEIICDSYLPNYRFCETEDAAIEFINAHENGEGFSIGFSAALAEKLFANNHEGLQRLMHRSRLSSGAEYSYSENSGAVTISNPSFLRDLIIVQDDAEFLRTLYEMLPERPAALHFEILEGTQIDLGSMDIRRYGVERYSIGRGGNDRVSLESITYPEHFALLKNEDEIRAYLQTCVENRWSSFSLYLTDEDYDRLIANNASRLFDMLKKAGLKKQSLKYSNETRMFSIENASY